MKCPNCSSKKHIEIITKGIRQEVVWDDDFIVKETTIFEKTDDNSQYVCADCGANLTKL